MGMKVIGIALVVVAVVAAVVPAFTNCSSEGLFITTMDGRQIDMKCFWTSRASIPVGIALAASGAMLTFSKRKETRRVLGVIGIILGATLIALPTELIGVCAMDKLCLNVMKPSMMLLGAVGIALSAAAVWFAGSGLTAEEPTS